MNNQNLNVGAVINNSDFLRLITDNLKENSLGEVRDLSDRAIKEVFNTVVDTLLANLNTGAKIRINGLGLFLTQYTQGSKSPDLIMEKPESVFLKFKVSNNLKQSLRDNKELLKAHAKKLKK